VLISFFTVIAGLCQTSDATLIFSRRAKKTKRKQPCVEKLKNYSKCDGTICAAFLGAVKHRLYFSDVIVTSSEIVFVFLIAGR